MQNLLDLCFTPEEGAYTKVHHMSVSSGYSPANTAKKVLKRDDYFFGNLSRTDAEAMLLSSKSKVFLIRPSSTPACFALSKFDYSTQTLLHLLVVPVASGGYKISDVPDPNVYITLDDLVNKSPMIAGFNAAKPPPPEK